MSIASQLAQNAQTLIKFATTDVSLVTLSNANVTLDPTQYNTTVIQFIGTLTASVIVTLPNNGLWTIYNSTSGAFNVTLSNGVGATALAPQGQAANFLSNSSTGILSAGSGGSGSGVASFNTRTGAVTLMASDVSGVGGALLASPAFTGTPTSTTPSPGDNSTKISTTAFVVTALGSYAPLVSPAFTGVPTAPTPANTSNNTDIATTAFVQNIASAFAGGLNYQGAWNASTNTPTLTSSVGTRGYLYQVSVAGTTNLDGNSTWNVGDLANFNGTVWQRIPAQTAGVSSFNGRTGAVTLTSSDVTTALGFTPANATSIAGLAPLASPTFTGVPAGPTASPGTNSTQLATTAFVVTSYAPLASPALTGVPTAPTASTGTNTTQIATTAFVQAAQGSFAPINSPAFTGTPTVPTATPGTNTTQAASTAYVVTALGSYAPLASPSFSGRVQSPAYSYTVNAIGNASGTQTLNIGLYSEFTMTIVGATTIAFTNTLGSNVTQTIYIRFTNAGAFSITWPASTKFANKTAPTFTGSGVDLVGVTYDTVTSTYLVFVIGLNVG
jgi:hypothetical protein